jgi:tRNA threonylcarbamoyladenosine modification (KEOPS) complex Cgi121 subunit
MEYLKKEDLKIGLKEGLETVLEVNEDNFKTIEAVPFDVSCMYRIKVYNINEDKLEYISAKSISKEDYLEKLNSIEDKQ